MAGERVSHYRRGVSVVLYSMTLKDKGVVGFPRPVTPPKLVLLHPGDAAHGLPNPAPAQSKAEPISPPGRFVWGLRFQKAQI